MTFPAFALTDAGQAEPCGTALRTSGPLWTLDGDKSPADSGDKVTALQAASWSSRGTSQMGQFSERWERKTVTRAGIFRSLSSERHFDLPDEAEIIRSMKISRLALCPVALALMSGPCWSQPFGLSNRVANTTLRMPPNPPVPGYATTNAFPGLSFTNPIVITTPPGETNRLFVAQQNGVIILVTNLAAPTLTVFMDIRTRVSGGTPNDERGLLGLAFHPGFETNRYFFLYYSTTDTTPAGSGLHQRLSRFEASALNPNAGLANSEIVLLSMFDQANNHNGGDMHFGADGYLYLSLGDEGDANDTRNNSQIIDKDLWAGIVRLDVDRRPENLNPNPHASIAMGTTNFSIPADNPFVGVTQWYGSNLVPSRVRTEFYAIGLRNPWRMSFDPATDRLYCGDVGQGAREEIDIIVKGGNYGWAFREGLIAGPKAMPPGAMHINPILDYGRGTGTNQGTSVTGGVVYHGDRLPGLDGAYIFADYVSGNIWALRYNGVTATNWVRLAGDTGISEFGIDPRNGDVLLADQNDDQIKRLVYAPGAGGILPPTLAGTGAFTNLTTLEPHAGILSYDVNVPSWNDGTAMQRWFYIPTARQITFRPSQSWSFPTGSVWIQHFELELTNGVPESRRRLETRFLVRDSAQGVYGVTYRWDDTQNNATLVPEAGMEETFVIDDGGTPRNQTWRYPSRTECIVCHVTAVGLALGFNTPQINRAHLYDNGVTDNQIRAMNNAGYFSPSGPVTNEHSFRSLAAIGHEEVSVEQRVRSYLTANCVQCHRGGGRFDARIFTPLSTANIVNGPLNDNGGDTNNRVVVPESLAHSMLLTRMSATSTNRMPPLGSTQVDAQAIALISLWITNDLAGYRSFADWQIANFGSTNAANAQPNADPDGDRAVNTLEYLTGTDAEVASDAWAIGVARNGDQLEVKYPRVANRGFEVQWNSNLTNQASWLFLNTLENRPFFSATNGESRVPDIITNGLPKFYRGRVYEP